jgi:hypothetical protein
MTLTMPTRELVGLLADVVPFASTDADDSTWHRVVLRWDGSRLFAFAGDGERMAQMSWGPDDGDVPAIPGLDFGSPSTDTDWELAILPENAVEIAKKFKVGVKEGETPLRVTGSVDSFTVERDAETGDTALRAVALARPWDDNGPRIDETIAELAGEGDRPRAEVAFAGQRLVDFVNPKKVRQRGVVVLTFTKTSAYVQIGRHFRGAVLLSEVPAEADR